MSRGSRNFRRASNSQYFNASTSTGQRLALSAVGQGTLGDSLRVYNSGAVPVAVSTGGNAIQAAFPTAGVPADSTIIPPGEDSIVALDVGATYIDAVTLSGSSVLYFCSGKGN